MDKVSQMAPNILPVTAELAVAFYGRVPRTMKALAAVLGEQPICIAGTFVNPEGVTIVFADIKPEMRRFKKTGIRMAWRVMKAARASGVRTFALADCNIESATRFLEYLGFTRVETRRGVIWQA